MTSGSRTARCAPKKKVAESCGATITSTRLSLVLAHQPRTLSKRSEAGANTIFYLPEMLPLMIDNNSGHCRGSLHLQAPGGDVLLELQFALRSPKEFLSYSRPAFYD